MALAWRNLSQSKLRTVLTTIGVIIGVGAIITMVSLGLGLQKNIVNNALSRLDVYTRITVIGVSADELLAANEKQSDSDDTSVDDPGDTGSAAKSLPIIDDKAIARMQEISGVKYVVPQMSFVSFTRFNNRTRRVNIGGAPTTIPDYDAFDNLLAGTKFSSDDAQEAILTEDGLNLFNTDQVSPFGPGAGPRRVGARGGRRTIFPAAKTEEERQRDASQVIGKELVLLTLKSGVQPASLVTPQSNPLNDENDLSNDPRFERHVFKIVGVKNSVGAQVINLAGNAQVFIPMKQAKHYRESTRDTMAQMTQALAGDPGYPAAEVRVIDPSQVQPVEEKLRGMGFRAFSITNAIDAIRLIFLIINGSLALIGGIALLVASFGISNTMIMSIRERTREIGIMKAIGGSDGEIMKIFFVEASFIGLSGGVFGVVGGWTIDAIANFVVNKWVIASTTSIQFFSIPWYLWGGAITFAVFVSLIAAIYPAFRAAKVDPIKALRHE